MDRLEAHRSFFANLVTTATGRPNSRITAAFASIPRENFLGPGPWRIFVGGTYINTPSADPAFLYQDVTVAISEENRINNGQPMLHAASLAALDPKDGDTVVHIGAGTGYYTALLCELVSPKGQVFAYELDPELAARAKANLTTMQNVTAYARSGADDPLPACDLCYVNAGATMPLNTWLHALRPGGTLLFPLTPDGPNGAPGAGGMLLVKRTDHETFDARFIMPVMFIPCVGARDEQTAKKLVVAFGRGTWARCVPFVATVHRMRAVGVLGRVGGCRLRQTASAEDALPSFARFGRRGRPSQAELGLGTNPGHCRHKAGPSLCSG